MKLLGQPFTIQNTDEGWLVNWPNAVMHGDANNPIETISFTVALPRSANLSIAEVQTFALKRAQELLQTVIAHQKGS